MTAVVCGTEVTFKVSARGFTEVSTLELQRIQGGQATFYCSDLKKKSTACGECLEVNPGWFHKCTSSNWDEDICDVGSYSGPAPSPFCTRTMEDCQGELRSYTSLHNCRHDIEPTLHGEDSCDRKYEVGAVQQVQVNCGS